MEYNVYSCAFIITVFLSRAQMSTIVGDDTIASHVRCQRRKQAPLKSKQLPIVQSMLIFINHKAILYSILLYWYRYMYVYMWVVPINMYVKVIHLYAIILISDDFKLESYCENTCSLYVCNIQVIKS